MRYLLIVLLIVFVGYSCNFMGKKNDKKIDSYYTRIAGWDYQRMPLIKPFELTKLKGFDTWSINTSELPQMPDDLSPIDSIFCVQSFIFGHKQFYQNPEWEEFITPEMWFVIDVKSQKLITYDRQDLFLEKNAMFFNNRNGLMPCDFYFHMFMESGTLPWFEDSIIIQIKTQY